MPGASATVPILRPGSPIRNQTALAACAYVTPHAEASWAGRCRPRPLVHSAGSAGGRGVSGMSWAGLPSSTTISTASAESLHVTCTDVPACTTALVTSSLVSKTASSISASGSGRSSSRPGNGQDRSVSRTNLRAAAAAAGSGWYAAVATNSSRNCTCTLTTHHSAQRGDDWIAAARPPAPPPYAVRGAP
jgi:hypothetical protein